ncbi:FHA domain-containing protein [Paraconexibacter sp.]|uniref:FHA domain-containing protein n=1 Tax=Paraconexibacter sp. TaxID=2949640 RepID=UPI003569F659
MHSLSPSERAALVTAEHEGYPFLAYRDGFGDLRIVPITDAQQVTIGRATDNDVVIDGDQQVSRVHAVLEHIGGTWALRDDGLSRNGSFVGGERVLHRQRLVDDDMLRVGGTAILFRCPPPVTADSTLATSRASAARLTEAERRVLVALCRPLLGPDTSAGPASNREIAAELVLSLSGVKSHLRSLSAKLAVGDLPQNRKRAHLARRALEAGIVTTRDLMPR